MMDLTPFYVAGNSEKFPVTLKGTNVLKMRTRVKMQFVASGRARRGNVPRHIHFIEMRKQLQVHPLKNMMFLQIFCNGIQNQSFIPAPFRCDQDRLWPVAADPMDHSFLWEDL